MALLNSNPMWSDEEKLKFIEEITVKADAVQERVLAEILKQNAETEYLQRHELDGATDRATFKAKVPVITYQDIQPDIERIANGDRSPILSAKPVTEFLTSSGTSAGRRKLIPTISEDIMRTVSSGGLITAILNRDVPGLNTGKRLEIMILRSDTKTPGGLVARPASTSVYKTFLNHFMKGNTCPPAAALCEDYFQSMYIQMLCGLYHRLHVVQISAIFASALVRSFQFLREHWPQLVRDIESGTLTDKITDKSLRESVSDILKPDPELAGFVAEQCPSADWSCIIPKLWPNVKCLRTIVTGAMSQYRPMLESYGGGGLPIVSMVYSCSESPLGINLHPLCDPSEVSYTLLPHVAYFEFIPHEPEKKKGAIELADLTKVEAGKKYELVITTYAGLYRYQVGDILQVTGFYNAAPQFKFVCREGVLLSIEMDKTDEVDLQRAVDSASELLKPHGATLAEYTSYADTESAPGHYVIYWELMESSPPSDGVLERCCLAMEEALNQVYRERRGTGEIGPLEIRVVRGGAFGKLMDLAVSRGAAVDQYKVPRCVKVREIVALLDSEMVSAHFSPACPKASPNSGA